jgi:hypothetical protein
MKKFEAIPHASLGPVRIGAKRTEIHTALGAPDTTFKKTPNSVSLTDAWFENALQVFYTAEGIVEFVEVSGHSGIEVLCFGLPVFSTDAVLLMDRFKQQASFQVEEGGCSFLTEALDIALWRPDTDEAENKFFATFGLGVKGYYA